MDMKWILAIVAVSLFIGGLVGALTTDFAAFIGATVFSFALIFSIAFYLMNRRRSKEGVDDEEEPNESEYPPEDQTFQRVEDQPNDPLMRDKMIEAYIIDFGINRNKSENLYDAGYSRWSDFSEAIPEDLLMVDGINPTVARRIISTVNSRN